jgi:hypothetical protein
MATPYERRRYRLSRDLAGKATPERIYSCLAKVRFPDEAVARAATAVHLENCDTGRHELWVYRCAHCRGWHATKREVRGAASVVAGNVFKEVGQ